MNGKWEQCFCLRCLRHHEHSAVPTARGDEIVNHVGAEDMRFGQLPFVLRLVAGGVERRVERIGIGRLNAMVSFEKIYSDKTVLELEQSVKR